MILAFGYILLQDPFSWRNILGILIAIVGMGLYSYFCVIDSQVKQSEPPAQLSQVKDGETEHSFGFGGTGKFSTVGKFLD